MNAEWLTGEHNVNTEQAPSQRTAADTSDKWHTGERKNHHLENKNRYVRTSAFIVSKMYKIYYA